MSAPQRRRLPGLIALTIGLGATAVILAAVPSAIFDLDRFSVAKETVLLGTALLATVLLLGRIEQVEMGVAEFCLAAFAIWSFLSAVLATNHWLAARSLGLTVGGTSLFYTARFASERGSRRFLIGLLVLAVVVGGATGLAQAYGWSSVLLADSRAPGGTLGNRNFLAHLMVLGIPLAGWLLVTAGSRLGMWLAGVAASAMIAAVVLSRSRAAWVGFAATVIASVVVGALTRGSAHRLPRGRLMVMLGALVLGALAALIVPNQLEWKSASPYHDSLRDVLNYHEGSGRGRLIQYQNSLRLAARDPVFGVGPGNWLVRYPQVATPGDPSYAGSDPIPTNPWPSSDWIGLIAERGVVGTLCWLAWLVALGITALRRVRDPEHGVGALAAIALIVGLSVQGLFDAVMLLAPPMIVALAGLGSLLPATRSVVSVPVSGRRSRMIMAMAVLLLGFAGRSAGELIAIVTAGSGSPRSRLEDAVGWDPGSYRLHILLAMRMPCPAAEVHARQAAALLPYHPWPRRLLERCR